MEPAATGTIAGRAQPAQRICSNKTFRASSGKAAVMSVSMKPGATQLIRMPRLAYSFAADFGQANEPRLARGVVGLPLFPMMPTMLVMLMMRPLRRLIMPLVTARMARMLSRLASSTASQSASLRRSRMLSRASRSRCRTRSNVNVGAQECNGAHRT